MNRIISQTATKTITLKRELMMSFPDDIQPETIDPKALDALLEQANIEWYIDEEDFEFDHPELSDGDDHARPDLIYSENLFSVLDPPTEIEQLFQAAVDLKRLGFVEDAKRIRKSVRTLARKIRRMWLQSSNYCPWDDDEWVEASNRIPEDVENHPEFLDGVRAIREDVERIRQGATQ